MPETPLSRALVKGLEQKGWTQVQLAKHFKVSKAAVNMWLSGKNVPDHDKVPDLVKLLKLDPALFVGEHPQQSFFPQSEALMPRPAKAAKPIPTKGEVAAGQWLDLEAEQDYRQFEQHPITAAPTYPVEAQYGLIVRGTSMNRVAAEGTVLHCLDLALAGVEPVNDDIVIIERRRQQEGLREVTAKRIRREGDTVILAPDSTDPKWKPIKFKTTKPPEDVTVSVVALVIGLYMPMRGRRL